MENSPLQFKNSRLNLTLLQLYTLDTKILSAHLTEKIAQAPKLVGMLPVIIDFSHVTPDPAALASTLQLVKSFHLQPVGCQGLDESLQSSADELSLPHIKSQITAPPRPTNNAAPAPTAAPSGPTKIIRQVIRSGTQIHSPGDLIVIGAVSHGAEVLANGNIFVYGPLRGRALAGIKGDTTAIVSCDLFDPELVSIAGIYLLSEGLNPDLIGDRVVVGMSDEKLSFESLKPLA